MKTDTLFYVIFQQAPAVFFQAIGRDEDIAAHYEFVSVEVKQRSFRIDGVFLPKLATEPIYFVEVQFQYDALLYARFFTEVLLYLDKSPLSNDWHGVLLFPTRALDPVLEPKSRRYQELLAPSRTTRLYLDELAIVAPESPGLSLLYLVVEQENTAGMSARRLLAQSRQRGEQFHQEMLELVEAVLVSKFPRKTRQEVLTMLNIDLNVLKQTRFYQEVLQEGKEEGREEGQRQMLIGYLSRKFGPLPSEVSQALSAITEAQQLEDLLEQAIAAPTLPSFHQALLSAS
ncbi:Rpn family recombination-promoting nuclease/putative transposase [Candidatus Cyanaurora vandensis]|uniref:Rpn family recombination-promoting nuclease/putative transposase n=1 Tax=Candidatus Cyanaurora vandensis TaxID=2714958 RepID=UPI00257C96BC|nr:Rpn family recombination-promoting nuclease/putative transposase [Candidatus Cyanaurora vandensis]